MSTSHIEGNPQWIKHFLKGFAESLPDETWLLLWNVFSGYLKWTRETQVERTENLNDAYWNGYRAGTLMFRGGD